MPLRILICLLGGLLTTLALAPLSWVWLAPLAPLCLYWALRDTSPKQAALLGWLYGCAFFGSGVSWVFVSIYEHSQTPLLIACLLTLLFVTSLALLFAIQGYIWRRWFSRHVAAFGFIGCWLLLEWLRSWLFTGFPWLYLGYATLDTPLAGWLPLGGVWLASLMITFMGMGIGLACLQRQPAWLLLSILPFTSVLLPKQWTETAPETLRLALVQPNIPQNDKWQPANRDWILQRYIKLSQSQTDQQLIVWPETAIPAFFSQVVEPLAPLLNHLDEHAVTLLSGMPTMSPDPTQPRGYRVHNSLVLLTGNTGTYHKQRLVPFGEYLPLENWLRGLISFFNLPMSSFALPQQSQTTLQVQGMKLSAAICYEIAYPGLVREMSRQADFLLTVSNDSWFGNSIAPAQHLQIARARAAENGRWLIRGTNNGITALVNPAGKVIAQLPQFEMGVLRGEVQKMRGQTPYQWLGDWPLLAMIVLLLMVSIRRPAIRQGD
ncbi:apolipoprotein N-acyltransferase [Pontibacter sp. JAM-7]|uniref:apolipoprotein N-acyltransferase n=1 Tax=Pontibacter sp. JAM-7 TaxID=3366581 RepID=UPI003AF98F14